MLYTHQNRSDGFGAQYQGIISTFIYCKKNNINYVYTPFNSVEHNYNNDPNYVNNLEKFINLKDNIENNTNIDVTEINYGMISHPIESNIDYYFNNDTLKFVKDCFWENKEKNHFKNNKINIAVQIRRENAHDNGLAGNRATTPNDYYLKIMNEIREKYIDTQLQFHIYSQGERVNFAILEKEDVEFHLDEELTNTFTGLVAADILVLSPSSFSYVAGLLSDGIIYYKQFWHNKKKDWILCG